ncbi:MAG: GNAT family N-acetyltransferase, partial [Vicinamibacteria bacterium]
MTDAPTFRDMTASDVAAAVALGGQNGWNQTEADWRLLLEPPSVFRAAVVRDRLVGTTGAVIYGDRLAWVCMVLVDPEERGRGLASRLLAQVLDKLPPVDTVGLDATPRGEPVYAKIGFRASAQLARLEATSPVSGLAVPAPARPIDPGDLTAVFAQDREILGADRARFRRQAREAAPGYAWCVEDESS